MAEVRKNFRLSEKEAEVLAAVAEGAGLNETDLLRWAIKNWEDQINLNMAIGKRDGPIKAELPKSREQRETEACQKYRKVTILMESGGFTPPKLWPVQKIEKFEDYQPPASYWARRNEGVVYVWSQNYDENERKNMVDHLLSPYSGLALGLGPLDFVRTNGEYDARKKSVQHVAEMFADTWLSSLRTIQEADAREERLWPIKKPATNPELYAAFLHYVRYNPTHSIERVNELCREVGITQADLSEIRQALTCQYTQHRNCYSGAYPWAGM